MLLAVGWAPPLFYFSAGLNDHFLGVCVLEPAAFVQCRSFSIHIAALRPQSSDSPVSVRLLGICLVQNRAMGGCID